MKRLATMRARRTTPDPDAPAKGAYREWRHWHGELNNALYHGQGLPHWSALIENRKALWRRVAAAARRDA